jgi:uncharacterized protein YdiU (UPF0061 family)
MSSFADAPSPPPPAVGWNWDNSYARLPPMLFEPARPIRVRAPGIAIVNHGLAAELGLDLARLSPTEQADLFTGQRIPEGAEPIAQAYAGHQFGGFTMLGDGRAILLGEHRTPSGSLVDIQLKGPGPTPYSRRGDGRAALGPMLREYVISEAMRGLGIPTTRSLAVATTGDPVYRETALRGAVLTRVAASHIRVGTFQYVAGRRDQETLRILADYTIARHGLQADGEGDHHLRFLRAVIERQAELIARWQAVGFIHGVMNTDNMALSGETIDYGPCAFMDIHHQDTVFSSIDHHGRYAYRNQPVIAQWNLARFAETLVPLLADDQERAVELAIAELNEFPARYERAWLARMREKLGLRESRAEDADLVQTLLDGMQRRLLDHTATFRALAERPTQPFAPADTELSPWLERWHGRLAQEGRSPEDAGVAMRRVNPRVIPRNHRVEEALAAAEHDDFGPFERLLAAVADPFDPPVDLAPLGDPPPDGLPRYRTFCGT